MTYPNIKPTSPQIGGIVYTEGMIVTLDAHTSDLLDAYCLAHNRIATAAIVGREVPCGLYEITPEELGRMIITSYLHNWLNQQVHAATPSASPSAPQRGGLGASRLASLAVEGGR